MSKLRGKVVLVTGASAGIGAATALAFAREGAKLLVCARRKERLEKMEGGLKEAGAEAVHSFELDVRDRAAVEKALNGLPDGWRAIDVLVNNAGLSRGLTKLQEDDVQNWEEMIDTNIKGLLYITRAIVPGMVERNSGHVINLGSVAGYITYANGIVYCASKAAEKALSEGMKLDLMGTAVRVSSVDPGMVETEFAEVRFRDKHKADALYSSMTPLAAADVADTILWVASRPPHVNIHNVLMTSIDQADSRTFNKKDGSTGR
jgi:3-hydroxy acid dehydrogenase / malonic semialdehyde reductase